MSAELDIFIVEDDVDSRDTLQDILQLDAHRVTTFPTATAFLEQQALGHVDVILMDRKLPEGMVEDLLPRLKRRAAGADFIIITAYADLHAAIAALREGVTDYLIKPVDPEALRTSLARIAHQRAVESELHRERRFAEKLLETAEAIVLVLDPQGRILRANHHLLKLTGYTISEVIHADWFELFIPAHDRGRIRSVFQRTVDQVKSRGVINPIVAKDGREMEIRWSNTTLRNAAGETTAVLGVGLDITDHMRAQRQLLQSERLAAIGQTMAGLAHESRNALQRIQNGIDLLQDQLEGQSEALQDVAKIEQAAQHIRGLLEEVRAYAAPINLDLSEQPLAGIWRRACNSLSHRTEGKCVSLRESFASDDGGGPCVLQCDATRIEQVFRNLFENSIEAATEPLRIEVRCHTTPDTITVEVSDNGPGIPESQRDTLFDAFATTKPTGTGLGLAICQRTIEAHGGELRLVPSASGATFEFQLPRHQKNKRSRPAG